MVEPDTDSGVRWGQEEGARTASETCDLPPVFKTGDTCCIASHGMFPSRVTPGTAADLGSWGLWRNPKGTEQGALGRNMCIVAVGALTGLTMGPLPEGEILITTLSFPHWEWAQGLISGKGSTPELWINLAWFGFFGGLGEPKLALNSLYN